ncbi:hypothetical protein SODALDRAFT_347555 [Sodiomyces alkalinus F11]|uniref:Uncharacterized protein n=1 Tax=Sodiomyces alkalinus (strain CBS 110278 / VKM F-3762 / F11) TaxID=1314773 RepID=A0A3N2Q7G6_SODAK|nr:hypothetical protein SODALDRAFT_347555 [Sodiomyces alkalinus F11]ROT42627.1 hypothetical protein SODALDRAFT_347555 [Sodiomyces alkalinus F11]
MAVDTTKLGPGQERNLALVPRQTIVCLDHFITIANHVYSSTTTNPSTALIEVPNPASRPHARLENPSTLMKPTQSKPPTPPTRIQPGRAAKRARACAARAEGEMGSRTKRKKPLSTWVLPGLCVGADRTASVDEDFVLHFAQDGAARLPQQKQPKQQQQQVLPVLLPEASALAGQVHRAVERGKRQRQRQRQWQRQKRATCAFGPAPWICEVCQAEDVVRSNDRGFAMMTEGRHSHADPGAGIGAPVAMMTPGCCVGEDGWASKGSHYVDVGWEAVEVREDQVVRLGPLRFVADMCDGQAKLLFLSGDWSGDWSGG